MKSVLAGLFLTCLLPLQACTTMYRAEPIEAWVVDADTAQPVEGVVVVAHWELETGELLQNTPAGQIMVMETLTDQKGRFYFPEWGPKWTPLVFPHPLKNPPHLEHRDPELLLFKPGYKWVGLDNYPLSTYSTDSVRKSDWNGKTIKMERFKGSLREYADRLNFLTTPLGFAEEDCNWKEIPTMILVVDQQYQLFKKNGIQSSLHLIDSLEGISRSTGKQCGSAREFFQRVQK